MLQKEFVSLVKKYNSDALLPTQLWAHIETSYSGAERFFHNLSHLQQMLAVLKPVQPLIKEWDTMVFALIYHDVVYDVVRYVTENDNEEQSADQAIAALRTIGFPEEKILLCRQHILATKAHRLSDDSDRNFLIDADLSILGQPWEEYETYMKAIRKEYEIYPDSIYNAGRMNVLKNFLRAKRLFKTEPFYEQWESPAKENIERELEILSFA